MALARMLCVGVEGLGCGAALLGRRGDWSSAGPREILKESAERGCAPRAPSEAALRCARAAATMRIGALEALSGAGANHAAPNWAALFGGRRESLSIALASVGAGSALLSQGEGATTPLRRSASPR